MTKNSTPNLSEATAVRVQHWLGKDLPVPLKHPSQTTKEFYTRHQCTPVRLPRALSLMGHLSVQACAFPQEKGRARALQVTRDSHSKALGLTVQQPPHPHQKDLQFFQMEIALSESDILWLRKEHFFATRRLKSLRMRESARPKTRQIVSLRSASEKQSGDVQPGKWERFKEERHFQISRM